MSNNLVRDCRKTYGKYFRADFQELYSLVSHSLKIDGFEISPSELRIAYEMNVRINGLSVIEMNIACSLVDSYLLAAYYFEVVEVWEVSLIGKLIKIMQAGYSKRYSDILNNISLTHRNLYLCDILFKDNDKESLNNITEIEEIQLMCEEIQSIRENIKRQRSTTEAYALSFSLHEVVGKYSFLGDLSGRFARLMVAVSQNFMNLKFAGVSADYYQLYIEAVERGKKEVGNFTKYLAGIHADILPHHNMFNLDVNTHKLKKRPKSVQNDTGDFLLKEIYKILSEEPTLSVRQLSKLLHIDILKIRKSINHLKSNQIISHNGPNKGGSWKLKPISEWS